MISHNVKRTALFAALFIVAMIPVYAMGLSGNKGLLIANVILAFVISSAAAIKNYKKVLD